MVWFVRIFYRELAKGCQLLPTPTRYTREETPTVAGACQGSTVADAGQWVHCGGHDSGCNRYVAPQEETLLAGSPVGC